MAKFSFKRPRIISKKFPEMDSTIDGVTKSLNDLVFTYQHHVDKTLQKKHIMMAVSSLALLLVLGSFISPKGKADSSIFYPETCLGGWINPHYAEGELQTTSNGDASSFTKNNSAVLPKNTNAELYCGSFKGKFNRMTKPTKILVSLALTKGDELLLEDRIESESFASSSRDILDTASSTDVSFTLTASTTSEHREQATSTTSTTTNTSVTSTSSSATPTSEQVSIQEITSPSIIEGVLQSLKDTVGTIVTSVTGKEDIPAVTPTSTPPPPAPQVEKAPDAPSSQAPTTPPTSYFPQASPFLGEVFSQPILSYLVPKVFAQSEGSASTTTDTPISISSTTSSIISTPSFSTGTPSVASTSVEEKEPTTLVQIASSTNENQFQNNFLEVFYTFDGITWLPLGELNEISMKYRTFEIPVTASTSWSDMSQLQIKIQAKKHLDETPTIYLDGIKVEVLYDTPSSLTHAHPDFARDTFLKDTTKDSVHVVNIINNDSTHKEIWYKEEDASSTISKASDTWSKIDFDEQGTVYTLLYIYDHTIFFVDSIKNMLWAYDITKDTHTGSPITNGATTSVSFFTRKDEEWAFEYNPVGENVFARMVRVVPEIHTVQIDTVVGDTLAKKVTQKEEEMIEVTIPQEESYHMYTDTGVSVQYSSLSKGQFTMNARDIHLGSYVVVLTTRVDGCEALTLDECKKDTGYTGELTITIGALPSPLATSTDVVVE